MSVHPADLTQSYEQPGISASLTTPHHTTQDAVLSDAERQRLLYDWNSATLPLPTEEGLHQMVAAQAARTPNAVAVRYGDDSLTYAELQERANQLAHHLLRLGVTPDSLVGLCLPRSLDLVVGLLGILTAGAAYVPLDPAYPQERLAFMLQDAAIAVLVTQESLLHLAANAVTVCVDRDAQTIAQLPTALPQTPVTTDNLAYVIYTSGSTGRPKGVAITHASARALLAWAHATFPPAQLAGVLAATSICFDLSIFELFAPLSCGGAVLLADDLLHLPTLPARQAVTLVNTVPSVLAALLTLGPLPPQVTTVNLAGEPLPLPLVQQLYAQPTVQAVFNLYGPTEDTTYSTAICVPADATTVTIGRPLPNSQAYLLDATGQPVPLGVVGELYLGGDGLARGYLNRPALTAEKFVPDPFAGTPGARLYRTGDLARYRADGQIEYLGRIDHQVKIRGFRIELGEIEAVLTQQPGVHAAVVVARRTETSEPRLVAYLVPQAGMVLDWTEIQQALAAQLPDYMVPRAVVVMDALPLTTNGKIDRKALPEPEEPAETTAYVAPRTALEAQLSELWAAVLDVPQVGIHDHFFALGGHSLAATRLVARMREALAVELPLRLLFEAPTIAELAAQLELKDARLTAASEIPLVAQQRTDESLLSFAQERLWFLDQLEPGNAAYNIPLLIQLVGPLQLANLEQSLNIVVARHEALRTSFRVVAGQPVQVIVPQLVLAMPTTDLSTLPEPERESKAQQYSDELARQPFDLTSGPLIRASVLRLTPEDHRLVLVVHHSVLDGWSIEILLRELVTLYQGFVQNEPLSLPALPIQYADYAQWQRQWLQGEILDRQLSYWRQQLAGLPAALELPTDFPRPPVQTFAGARHTMQLAPDLTAQLLTLGQTQDATLFMTLLAAFQLLLARLSGQDEIAVGTPIAGRTRPEVEPVIGFFVNTLVLRGDLRDNPSFTQLLAHVRETTLGAFAHQDLPFEHLVEDLRPPRDLSRTPLFQVMFGWEVPLPDAWSVDDLQLSVAELPTASAKFDLTVMLNTTESGLSATVDYPTALFTPDTIVRLCTQFQTLLRSIVADPQQQIAKLAMLDDAERHLLLDEWNSATVSLPAEESLHQLVAAQVARTPHAVAVVEGAQEWTYAALNARANQLAHYLRAHGAGPEVLVGIALPRTADLVVAILAVLKTGAAYVPLDPAYPQDRLAFMLADAQAPLLVTQAEILPQLHTPTLVRIELDGLAARLAQQPTQDLAVEVDSAQLAYVIYTSGSTGRPKGVAITHASARALLAWAHATFPPAQLAGVLAATSICFDLSIFELFAPLTCGGAVLLADDLLHLPSLPARQAVTLVNTVPSVLAALLTLGPLPPQVTTVNLAGEPLPLPLVQQLYAQPTVQAVFNLYGPTEDTTYSTAICVPADATAVTIGRPLPNSQAYLLDAVGQPVPLGVVGELYLGGDGLARGYLNRPALTAEKFVPDPFAGTPGARLYRTGDLARYRADGQIEYLGRIDHQVKIRGFRIELGEIEAVLAQQPGVHAAVVVARRTATSEPRLVAYVVPDAGVTLDRAALQQALAAHLPAYMQPNAWVVLQTLPLTPSGKVDRKALPEPEEHAETTAYVAPRTALEAQLSELWAAVLDVPQVGIHDHFFALGGHSLAATRLVARIQQTLAVELPLRLLFEAPTIAQVADYIETTRATTQPTPDSRITRATATEERTLSFAQQRLWFVHRLDAGNAFYNLPIAIRLSGKLDQAALQHSLNIIIERHEVLRTTYPMVKGVPVAAVAPDLRLSLPLCDLQDLAEPEQSAEVQRRIQHEIQQPFDLATGPLIRAAMLRLSETQSILLLTLHHIAFDGWSTHVLVEELAAAYSAYVMQQPVSLPALPIQYADYARWQRQWLQGEVLERQLSYWRQQLADAPRTLNLPTDYPRPPIQTFAGSRYALTIAPSVTADLKVLSQAQGCTLFMTLLAAFQLLLARLSSQDEIVVGTPIAGRTRPEVEPVIGFFVNTLVLRADLRDNPTFTQLLARVRETTLGAFAHQDLPFEHLVEDLRPQRDLSRNPLFQVMFDLQTTELKPVQLPDLILDAQVVNTETAKFDFMLDMQDTAKGLCGTVEYNTDLFMTTTVIQIIDQFNMLLDRIVANPDQRLSDLLPALNVKIKHPEVSPEARVSDEIRSKEDVDSAAQASQSARRAQLSVAKRALLEKRLRGENAR